MSDAILVTYATRYGSTQEVAEQVAATLRQGGLQVDILPARQVRSLDNYRAVVLGAPLYIGHWLKDAPRFLTRHQAALAARPVAIFTLGPTKAGEEGWQGVRAQLDKVLGAFPWLKPVSAELFGGRYDPAGLRFPDNLLGALPASPLYRLPASDLRDWEAIRSWARDLASKL
jgi:menaquinone-dependent protoporphyrinogen oxidase